MRIYESAAARYAATRGRCVSCGFLAKHRDRWHEATEEERETGTLLQGGAGWEHEINTVPACFVRAADLPAEYQAGLRTPAESLESGDTVLRRATLNIVTRDRGCPQWYPYSPGFSPKEHLEELRMMQLEDERRKHDLELAALQREADQRSLAIADALRATTDATAQFTTKWTYIAVGLAAAALIVLAIGYILPGLGPWLGNHVAPQFAPTPKP